MSVWTGGSVFSPSLPSSQGWGLLTGPQILPKWGFSQHVCCSGLWHSANAGFIHRAPGTPSSSLRSFLRGGAPASSAQRPPPSPTSQLPSAGVSWWQAVSPLEQITGKMSQAELQSLPMSTWPTGDTYVGHTDSGCSLCCPLSVLPGVWESTPPPLDI